MMYCRLDYNIIADHHILILMVMILLLCGGCVVDVVRILFHREQGIRIWNVTFSNCEFSFRTLQKMARRPQKVNRSVYDDCDVRYDISMQLEDYSTEHSIDLPLPSLLAVPLDHWIVNQPNRRYHIKSF
jgi:hypothetical protein